MAWTICQRTIDRRTRYEDRRTTELIDEPWYSDHHGRLEHQDELDEIIGSWIGERTADEVLDAFAESEGAIAPMYSIKEIVDDPQYQAERL